VRDQEIAQCLSGEISTWQDGKDRPAISARLHFRYLHADAPAWFDEATVLDAVRRAAAAWSSCGIGASVEGAAAEPPGAQTVTVQWSEVASAGNFGLANPGRRMLSLGPAAFVMLRRANPSYDARQTLQMVISHEMGHLFGLMAHSMRCVDVTSYYTNGQGEVCHIRGGATLAPGVEYRATLPTACDIARCRAANGIAGQ
jgi:hypothetical protein